MGFKEVNTSQVNKLGFTFYAHRVFHRTGGSMEVLLIVAMMAWMTLCLVCIAIMDEKRKNKKKGEKNYDV